MNPEELRKIAQLEARLINANIELARLREVNAKLLDACEDALESLSDI